MSQNPRLAREALAIPAEKLAPAIIGCVLVRVLDSGVRLSGRIVETEAYLGVKDRAAHSFGGRRTPRNEAMYARAGTAYVYFTYGMHFCVNVVCGMPEEPVAVLVRALEPLEGLELMAEHRTAARKASSPASRPASRVARAARRPARGGSDVGPPPGLPGYAPSDLCSGPGKLCSALRIDRSLNGADLCESSVLFLEQGAPARALVRSPRIGIDSAGAWAARNLRWHEKDNPCVSR